MSPTHSPQTSTVKGSRPGGRSTRVRADVHRAVSELLAEGSPEAVTIPGIGARAGVHPTTIYRRWGTLGDLMTEVARSRFTGDLVVPDHGDLRSDLEAWAESVATDVSDPDSLAVMRASVGIGGPEGGCACVEDRHAQLTAILAADEARGGPHRDPSRAADLLLGPIYYRALFVEERTPDAWVAEVVATYLRSGEA